GDKVFDGSVIKAFLGKCVTTIRQSKDMFWISPDCFIVAGNRLVILLFVIVSDAAIIECQRIIRLKANDNVILSDYPNEPAPTLVGYCTVEIGIGVIRFKSDR